MQDQSEKIIPIAIEDEVKESYLNYAMSVIVSRALPGCQRWFETRTSKNTLFYE